MRVDHFAYQRATRTAGFGFFLQLIIGVVLLVFSMTTGSSGDTATFYGALYVLCGLLVWLSLIVLYHQHKLQRLEALEDDEIAAARAGTGSVFESQGETNVAARRLQKIDKWLMPGVSLLLAVLLAWLAWRMWSFMSGQRATGPEAVAIEEFARTPALGWAVAICLAFAAISFIFSRFVAGMAKQPAWQNLRGGAGYMVGNALVLFAIATGVIFRFFQNDAVIEGVVYAIAVMVTVIAAEIVLNFVLNLYRPRIPGEMPRAAFDSRVLGMLAAPDSLVRSINEAVNYQFGFDVTSTWGYKLLMRSVAKLAVIGIAVLVVLSMMVVVEPQQQALKLSGGRIVGDRAHESGLMWKLPWPLQSASIHDVWRVRELPLTARRIRDTQMNVWNVDLKGKTDRELEPFLVLRSRIDPTAQGMGVFELSRGGGDLISEKYSLLDIEVVMQYRVRGTDDGLLDYLQFASDTRRRRDVLDAREKILRDLGLREVTSHLATLTIDEVLSQKRGSLAEDLRQRIQDVYDQSATGVDVLAINVPLIRPSGDTVKWFEDMAIAVQNLELYKMNAEQGRLTTFAYLVGDPASAEEAVVEVERFFDLQRELGSDAPQVLEQRDKVERMLVEAGGNAGQQIAQAYTDRWGRVLTERANAVRFNGQLAAYRAAPDLYTRREIMRVYKNSLPGLRTFILGIDPARVGLDVELKELNPMFDLGSSLSAEGATP